MSDRAKKILKELSFYVAVVLVAVVIRVFFLVNAYTPTGSMEKTVPVDSRHLGLKCAYWFSGPERGDIIVFDAPEKEDTEYLKRVIGLPGETVEIKAGKVYIDGALLVEDYINGTPKEEDLGPFHVPEGCVFVMGDNRNNSHDSRYWGSSDPEDPLHYVPIDTILGKQYLMYWPNIKWLY